MSAKSVKIDTEYIRLGDLLKYAGAADSGGEAKAMIRDGKVLVNGEAELRRGRKLRPGDRVETGRMSLTVE